MVKQLSQYLKTRMGQSSNRWGRVPWGGSVCCSRFELPRLWSFGLLLASTLLGGCGLVTDWVGSSPTAIATLPPCVEDDCDCSDFISRTLAQQVMDAIPRDPYQLDGDGNGQACDGLVPEVNPVADPPAPAVETVHLRLGNPSQAATSNVNNYLLVRSQYALSYNRDRGTANWVSWQLNRSWLGNTDRQDNFRADGGLPKGVYQVRPNDYSNSGYDRGHLTPSGDRTANTKDNAATFLMTNIIPQAPDNNRGPWRELEEYGRLLVQQGKELYIIAGAYGNRDRLAKGRLIAPSRTWKVIVVLDQPGAGLDSIQATTRVIAVDMPNHNGLAADWRTYGTSVDRIEVATGYDLLSNLPPEVQAILEAQETPSAP